MLIIPLFHPVEIQTSDHGKSTGSSKITFNIAQIKPINSGYAGMISMRYVKDEAFRNYVNRSVRPPWL